LVDTSLEGGSLSYAELLVRGRSEQEFLFSAHVCHPSLANDNLSGVAVCSQLAAELSRRSDLRYSYRFLFAPGTIGAISWLAHNRATTENIRFGLTAPNLGDSGGFSYKRSRRGDAAIDRIVTDAIERCAVTGQTEPFLPDGYDETQFCSPGFDLPVGALSRSRWGKFS
jgi:aminopeptidase-like protein